MITPLQFDTSAAESRGKLSRVGPRNGLKQHANTHAMQAAPIAWMHSEPYWWELTRQPHWERGIRPVNEDAKTSRARTSMPASYEKDEHILSVEQSQLHSPRSDCVSGHFPQPPLVNSPPSARAHPYSGGSGFGFLSRSQRHEVYRPHLGPETLSASASIVSFSLTAKRPHNGSFESTLPTAIPAIAT